MSLFKMAFKLLVLSCFLALASAAHITERLGVTFSDVQSRIVGGENAVIGQFPHQVSLQMPSRKDRPHFCGGSILNANWILTAAHCVVAVPQGDEFLVKAGKVNISKVEETEQTVEVEKSFVHKLYVGSVAPYDIALLKLKTPFKFNEYITPINLPQVGSEPEGDVTISGWGWTSRTSVAERPQVLQHVTVPIVDRLTCNKTIIERSIFGDSPLHETNICTGPLTGGRSSCKGDSGGPLIATTAEGVNEVVGVVSWGFVPCGGARAPSVFVKVASFLDWIDDIISKNSN